MTLCINIVPDIASAADSQSGGRMKVFVFSVRKCLSKRLKCEIMTMYIFIIGNKNLYCVGVNLPDYLVNSNLHFTSTLNKNLLLVLIFA